jgi:TolB-like protein/DNA-binding winged helix-turn-helix (wHTH) protein/Tfp pilus assembly protein PilF
MLATVASTHYRVDDLRVDVERRRVMRGDTELPVAGISFDLFLVLVRAAPDLVSVEELMRCVWPDVVVSPDTVSQRVRILRQALNDAAEKPRYVAGVHGRGYCLVALVTVSRALEPEAGHALLSTAVPVNGLSASSAAGSGRTLARSYRYWYWVAALIALALLAMTFLARDLRRETAVVAAKTGAVPLTATEPSQGVAVLPFVNLTGDPAKDYLGDGMAEEVINTLTKVPGLKVPARTSSFAYKGRSTDIRQIAKELGVGAILEGSVREAGTRIRITAELISAQDGLHIWSETYDRKFTDLFKLQDDLATSIVHALKVRLNDAEGSGISYSRPTQDVEAYDQYLQGVALMQRASPPSFDLAEHHFQLALSRDPKFADAYAALGSAKLLTAVLFGIRTADNLVAADQAAQQALRLDPNAAGTHMLTGSMALIRGHMRESYEQMRTALQLAPNDGQLHMNFGAGMDTFGYLREALAEENRAYQLAPASPPVPSNRAVAYVMLGRDAEALQSAHLAEDLGMYHADRGLAFVYEELAFRSGDYSSAAAAALTALDTRDAEQARTAEIVKLVYAALDDPSRRPAALAARSRLYPQTSRSKTSATMNAVPCLQSSYAYALLGELDVAYGMANRCLDSLAAGGISYGTGPRLWTPEMRSFRRDPRFQALVTRLGYMDVWQQSGPPDECNLKDGRLACR